MQRAALGWCRSLAFAYDPRVDAAGRTGVGEAPDEDLHVAGRCHDAGPGDGAGGHCLRWRDDRSQALFPKLTNTPLKRDVVIEDGTHTVRWRRTGSSFFVKGI